MKWSGNESWIARYILNTNSQIHNAGRGAGKSLQTEDLRRALSGPGDERKLARLEELIVAQMAIKKARAVGGMDKPTQLAEYQHA